MTDNKANITISLSVDMNRLSSLISFLTKDAKVKMSVETEPVESDYHGTEVDTVIVDEVPAEVPAVAEEAVEVPAVAEEAVEEPAVAEEAVAEEAVEEPAVSEEAVEEIVDFDKLCDSIADNLRKMAKDGRRKEAKDIMARYKVTALSKLNTLHESKIIELYNELQEY